MMVFMKFLIPKKKKVLLNGYKKYGKLAPRFYGPCLFFERGKLLLTYTSYPHNINPLSDSCLSAKVGSWQLPPPYFPTFMLECQDVNHDLLAITWGLLLMWEGQSVEEATWKRPPIRYTYAKAKVVGLISWVSYTANKRNAWCVQVCTGWGPFCKNR